VAQLTEQLGLARHKARSFWGLLARTAATILADTIVTLRLV
jgi:predicted house-cleaning NTP pyrophosphatase (Maf/HAM1 superfamily)